MAPVRTAHRRSSQAMRSNSAAARAVQCHSSHRTLSAAQRWRSSSCVSMHSLSAGSNR